MRSCGFSLIELMAVLSVVGILAVMSVVGFNIFLKKTETEILSSQLLRAIDLTRSEAILRHETIQLCGSQDQENCSNNWDSGYIVRSANRVIYHFQNISQKGILHWRSFPMDRVQLEFIASGMPHFQNGTFWFCPPDAKNPAWSIVLNKTGRARIVYPDKDGNVRDDKGVKFTC